MTMATAVELRVPFLDHKMVEFSATLPESLKISQNKGKWILREAMRNVLPPSIIHRSKKGFPSPAAAWFRVELRDFVRDALLGSNAACRIIFTSALASVAIIYLAFVGLKVVIHKEQEARDNDVPVEVKQMFKIAR